MINRKPVDDAPPYDPSQWSSDCFFLCQIEFDAKENHPQHRVAPKVHRVSRKALLARVANWALSYVLRRPPEPQIPLTGLTNDDLFSHMRTLLNAGDADGASLCAKELARRKAVMPVAPSPSTSDSSRSNENRFWTHK